MTPRRLFTTAALTAFLLPAQATVINLTDYGSWQEFTVDEFAAPAFGTGWIDFADGSPLEFVFTVGAGAIGRLTVVDAGFAGDTFTLTNDGVAFGQTSSVPVGSTDGPVLGDFDAALADSSFSRGVFTLLPATYRISGSLLQSVMDGDLALNSTYGGISLTTVPAIPEPETWALMFAGLGAIGAVARRRQRKEVA